MAVAVLAGPQRPAAAQLGLVDAVDIVRRPDQELNVKGPVVARLERAARTSQSMDGPKAEALKMALDETRAQHDALVKTTGHVSQRLDNAIDRLRHVLEA